MHAYHLDAAALDPPRPARLRLDVGVLDERGLELAARLDQVPAGRRATAWRTTIRWIVTRQTAATRRTVARRTADVRRAVAKRIVVRRVVVRRTPTRRRHFPGVHAPAGEHVVRPVRVDGQGAGRERVARVGDGRERFPLDGKPIVGQPGEGVRVADQREHRLAAVAHDAGREHRLILDLRVDAEPVDARDVGGGEDAGESGMALVQRGAVAEGEARVRVGGAHHPQPERAGGHAVRAEDRPARDLAGTVHAREPAAYVPLDVRVLRAGVRARPAATGGRRRICVPSSKIA